MGQFYLFITLIIFLSQSSVLNAQLCNGYSELCGRAYNDVAFPGTHNSFSYSPVPVPAENQFSPVAAQLQAGIRSLMLDGHNPPPGTDNPDGIHLCHTSCALLNAGDSVKTLKVIADFLNNNPTEIVTIIWENYDNLPASKYLAAYQAAGLDVLSYVQPAGQQTWPTLQTLINMNKRCINFIDRAADPVNVPWLMDEFTYVIDTPFENTSTDLSSWNCVVDRPAGGSPANIGLININHFRERIIATIEIPDSIDIRTVNSYDNIKQHLTQCTGAFGRIPNFISFDFSTVGDVFTPVAELNGLQPKRKTKRGFL